MNTNELIHKTGIRLSDYIRKRKAFSYYEEGLKSLKLSKEETKQYQFRKLKRLAIHAFEQSEFYNQRMKAVQFNPYEMTNPAEIEQIPVLTRSDLQKYWRKIVAKNYNINHLNKGSSSGSTGSPVIYYKDSIASSAGEAANYLGWSFSGFKLGMKGLHIWGNPATVNNEWQRLSSKVKAKIYNHYKFPAYKLTSKNQFEELVNILKKGNFTFLDGYTNAIYLLANYIKENKISIKGIDFIFTTGENLLDYQRDIIEKYLGPVYDAYGCSEINGVAYQCGYCNSYHTIDNHVYVEFGDYVDNDTQKLIITDLDNSSFPLIRYENDDLVQKDSFESNCKVPFGTFKKIVGRQSDIIDLPDGGYLSVPSFFGSMLLKQIGGVKHYQVIRETKDFLRIRMDLNRDLTKEEFTILNHSLNEYIGNQMRWEIDTSKKINVESNGKFKQVIDKTK